LFGGQSHALTFTTDHASPVSLEFFSPPENLFPGIDMSCNKSCIFRLNAEITKSGSYIYSFVTNYRVFSAEERNFPSSRLAGDLTNVCNWAAASMTA
jgi:hypothetical protein